MGISLDSLDPEKHSKFRGLPDAFELTVQGMKNCGQIGLPFQIHTTALDWNRDEVLQITDFCVEMGARAHYVFFLIPVGRGVYLEENDMAYPFFQQWNKALESIGFGVLSPRKTGGTDHVTFDRIGLPAFQFIQDGLEYGRGYHTAMDTYERLIMSDLQYNAAVVAILALSAAMDTGKIPPKPLPTGFSMQRR